MILCKVGVEVEAGISEERSQSERVNKDGMVREQNRAEEYIKQKFPFAKNITQ